MADESEETITPQVRELFNDIAGAIRSNPTTYREAGRWLDEYCSDTSYWARKCSELEFLKAQKKSSPTLPIDDHIRKVEEDIRTRRLPSLAIRFQQARHSLLDKYEDQQFIPEEDARRIILITWLLTEPDTEKANLNITDLEKWPWGPVDDVTKMSRGFVAYLWSHGGRVYVPWMRLLRIAWEKVLAEHPDRVSAANSHRLIGETWNVFGIPIHVRHLIYRLKHLKGWRKTAGYVGVCLVIGLLLAIVTAPIWIPLVRSTMNPDKGGHAQTEAKTNGDLSPAIITTGPNSPVVINYDTSPIGNTYRPLSPELRMAMISALKAIRKIDSQLGMKIFIDTESGNSNRQHMEEELVSIIAAAGFAVHGSGDSTILRGRTVPPVEILVNTARIQFAERFSRAIRPLINTNITLSKSESFSKDALKIFVRGEPLFSRDGVVTFR